MSKWISAALSALVAASTLQATAQVPNSRHVFVIMLENEGYATTFGPNSAAPYLANTLTGMGQLLTNYYGIGHNSNDNYLAMISGQAPNSETQSDCQVYTDFTGAGIFAPYGQLVGQGCVYPNSLETLPNQLEVRGYTWRGYMEDMPSACSHPALNTVDTTQKATPTNAYAVRHNPFVYFHSILDTPSCAANDVPLTSLQQDLQSVATTPNFSYIVPNLCHDGHDSPCADGEPGGLVSADAWLQRQVPAILSSPAYKQDGILIVTFDEASFGASSSSDSTACCNEQPGPNSPLPGITGSGGGRVGAVVISRFVKPGTRNANPYNHYSFLKSIETIFGLPYLGFASPSDVPVFGADVFSRGTAKH